MEAFTIAIPQADIDDLKQRLARTRFPGEVKDSGWTYGTNLGYLDELAGYWRDHFDWRTAERKINELPHFRDRGVHFVHLRGTGPSPKPLLLLNGWPSSFYEYNKVVEPLADPARFGGESADSFDVIVPSLPGYGFSDITAEPGWTPQRMADRLVELMSALGYERFVVHGTDWGSLVAALIAHRHADRVRGLHLTGPSLLQPRPQLEANDPGARERATAWRAEETGYQAIQGTKPQTLSYGLTDSPAGLAAWIAEKWRAWSDCGGEVERRFSKDELLTNISIYWFTKTINSANRLYYEARHDPVRLEEGERITVPAGFSIFPSMGVPARARAETTYDVRYWNELPRGGHFPAMEEPELFVDELRAFTRLLVT